jgi:hypothetical protein
VLTSAATGWLRRPFPWVALAGAALAVAYPALIPYVIAGVVLGLAAEIVSLRSRTSDVRWAKRKPAAAPALRRGGRGPARASIRFAVVAALGLLALVVAATALFSVGGGDINYSVAPSIEIEGTSTVEVEYARSTEELAVKQTLELDREQVAAAAADRAFTQDEDAARLGDGPAGESLTGGGTTDPAAALEQALIEELAGQGWQQSKLSNRTLAFSRSDTQSAMRHRWIPAEQTNVVNVTVPSTSVPSLNGGHVVVDFRLTEKSRATLSAPHHVIGEIFPASSERETRPRDKREFIAVPIDDGTAEVEFEVRSPLFRNEVAASAVDLSGWTVFKWLVATALALSNEALRELITKGWKAVTKRSGVEVG